MDTMSPVSELGEKWIGPSVTDEMVVVFDDITTELDRPVELPFSIGELGQRVTRQVAHFSQREPELSIFNAVDLPPIKGGSSMAIQAALSNLRAADILINHRTGTRLVPDGLRRVSGDIRPMLSPKQADQLHRFSGVLFHHIVCRCLG